MAFKSTRRSRRHRNPQPESQQSEGAFFQTKEDPQANAFFQPKLKIGQPGDKYEREADAVADAVVSNKATAQRPGQKAPGIQRVADSEMEKDRMVQEKSEPEEESLQMMEEEESMQMMGEEEEESVQMQEEEEEPVQMMEEEEAVQMQEEEEESLQMMEEEEPVQARATVPARPLNSARLGQRLNQRAGRGRAMDTQTRTQMEHGIGHQFGGVNIHTDEAAAEMNRELGAKAFTRGEDIYFNTGEYRPETSDGQRLLAHELTHVVQQGESEANEKGNTIQRKTAKVLEDDPKAKIQAKLGDGHDLTSPNFSKDLVLESVYDKERTLRQGSKGGAVTKIQQALIRRGYAMPTFGADGDFGKETLAAVRAFQQDVGIGVDGVIGQTTMTMLDKRDQGQQVAPHLGPLPVTTTTPLNMANVIVEPGATPIHHTTMGASEYGYTDTETVTIHFTAVKNGTNWQPVVTGLTGNYSLRFRLLAGQTEVDPGSNTNAGNFCAQATELNALGNPASTAQWYMLAAVLAHERVHAAHLRPALVAAAPAIKTAIEAVSIPDSFFTPNAAVAEMMLRVNPAFTAAVRNARTLWDTQYVSLISGDHAGPAAAAERRIVDPAIRRICRMARRGKWGSCPGIC